MDIKIKHIGGEQRVFLNGGDVTDVIRSREVSCAASKAAVVAALREKLVGLQRELARDNDVVMDGRDIGSAVLPDADLKVYLDAKPEVRALRRYKELVGLNPGLKPEDILREILERDECDSTREHSPLVRVQDAVYIDSCELSPAGVVQKLFELAEARR